MKKLRSPSHTRDGNQAIFLQRVPCQSEQHYYVTFVTKEDTTGLSTASNFSTFRSEALSKKMFTAHEKSLR